MSICREESEWIPPCFHEEKAEGPLADPQPSLHENEGEDAGASSPSHMRNYLATIDRLPAERSAAGRWCEIIWRRLIGFLLSEARQEDGRVQEKPQFLRDQGLRLFLLKKLYL